MLACLTKLSPSSQQVLAMQFPVLKLLSFNHWERVLSGRKAPPAMASSPSACFIFPLSLVRIQLMREDLPVPGISTARNIFHEGAQAFWVGFFFQS